MWEITHCQWTDHKLMESLLWKGYEPFAVTTDEDGPTIWLRIKVRNK